MLRIFALIGFFISLHSNAQNHKGDRFDIQIDTAFFEPPSKSGLSGIDFNSDTLWVYHEKEIYYTPIFEDTAWHKLSIENQGFMPAQAFVNALGERVFQSRQGELLIWKREQQEDSEAFELLPLDKKHRGKYILPNTSKEVVRSTANDYVFLLHGGSPGYLASEKAKRIRDYYQKAKLLGVFNSEDGSFKTAFATYDSAYHQPGTQWAKDFYASYIEAKNEYWVGNLLTPRIDRYNGSQEFIGSFGDYPEGYDYSIPIIESPKERYLIGLQHIVERHHFHDFIHTDKYVYRIFAKPAKDTTVLDKDYVRFLFIEEKDKGSCSKPNPIIKGQNQIIRDKNLHFQIYSSSNFEFIREVKLPLKAATRYIGTSSEGKLVFTRYKNNKVILYMMNIIENDFD